MKQKLQLLSAILVILFAVACEKENASETTPPCDGNPLVIKTLESEYGCTNTKNSMQINLQDTFTVIKTAAAFTQQVSGTCTPAIDFTAYDLIIGKKTLTTGNQSIAYEAKINCTTEKLELKVIFNQNVAGNAPNLTYHILVPKALNVTQQNVKLTYQIQ
jgi:hypothetical protein